jgi:hypothetical protein
MEMKTPEQYVNEIDALFIKCRAKKLGRMSLEWGEPSAEMNREIRQRIEDKDPESVKLKYIYVYWVLRSGLLELFARSKGGLLFKGKITRQSRECKKIRKVIFEITKENPLGITDEENNSWVSFVDKIKGRGF